MNFVENNQRGPAPYTTETLDRIRSLAAAGTTIAGVARRIGWSESMLRRVSVKHGILFPLDGDIASVETARPRESVRRTPKGKLVTRSIGFDPKLFAALERSADRARVTLQVRITDLLKDALSREAMVNELMEARG